MTEQEREELIEKMARYIACASSSEDDPASEWCDENWPAHENQARAALAVAEPVIREQCAKICDRRYMGDNNREDMEARRCAAAIRGGEKVKAEAACPAPDEAP